MIDPGASKSHPVRFYECELDIKTVSEANKHEHWTKSNQRHASQKLAIWLEFKDKAVELPCMVKFSRISPRLLDKDENLPMAFKWIKDQIAECIIRSHDPLAPKKPAGRYDDDFRLTWQYAQEKGKPQRIKIEIFSS